MNRILTLMMLLFMTAASSLSQTISPAVDQEYCPGVDYTFTVTVPGALTSVASWTNSPMVVSSAPPGSSTFNFVGRFQDANVTQVFRVFYTTSQGSSSVDFEFKKIKSFFFTTTCTFIYQNISSIESPPCQITTHNISFANIQYGNYTEEPDLCFGTINNYEYLLPQGWSLGSTVSNGTTWIPGGNNVTVTSDLDHGNGSAILIRPASTCGAGLVNAVQRTIPIFRNGPLLRISGHGVICAGSEQYTINGLPNGATVQWSIDNTADASISNTTSPTVTLTRTTSFNSFVRLTATVTNCSFTYTVYKQITLGTLYSTFNIVAHWPSVEGNCFETNAFHFFEAIFTGGFQPDQYQWGYRTPGSTVETILPSNTYIAGPILFWNEGTYEIFVRTGSECGLISESVRTVFFCDPVGGPINPFARVGQDKPGSKAPSQSFNKLNAYPNPASHLVTFELPDKYAGGTLKVLNLLGQVLQVERVSNNIVKVNVYNLQAGVHLAEVVSKDGRHSERMKIVISH
jgi:hypothetical protein